MKASNTPKYITTYESPDQAAIEQYLRDISNNLTQAHGNKPGLLLGYYPTIYLRFKKDTDGVSLQIKKVINDLNTHGSNDSKGIILPYCDLTDVDIGVLVKHLKPFAFDLTTIDLSYNRLGNGAVENLFYTMGTHQTPAKYVNNINLSCNFIGDYGAEYIAESIKSGRYPNLKSLNIGSNQITPEGFQKMSDILGKVAQDIFIITEESNADGKAVFKNAGGDFYDMVIKSDGADATIEFADGTTGISGVSAGDTCLPSLANQLKDCIKGAVSGGVVGWGVCPGGDPRTKAICVANAALLGCGTRIVDSAADRCVDSAIDSVERIIGGSDGGDFSFSATGGTEIGPTTIDNDHRLSGSSVDLSQHDF